MWSFKMSNRIILKVSKTIIKTIDLDLDEWYSYSELNKKEQHNQIQELLNNYEDVFEEQCDMHRDVIDWDLLEWELD
tara:strand:- start:516 stop:746 length:231 start_codon:yes stop_codon:yes gene_type:complete